MRRINWILGLVAVLFLAGGGWAEGGSDTAFVYEGQLHRDGVPANGTFDLEFWLYDQPLEGLLLGSVVETGVVVTDGDFAVEIDFGFHAATRTCKPDRWLETHARLSENIEFTKLMPRQPLKNRDNCTVDGNLLVTETVYTNYIDVNYDLFVNHKIQVGDGDHWGWVEVSNSSGSDVVELGETTTEDGWVATKNSFGYDIIRLTSSSDDEGYFRINDQVENRRVTASVNSGNAGFVSLYGPSGNHNVVLDSVSGENDSGWVSVLDASGTSRAAMYIAGGISYLSADQHVDFHKMPKSGHHAVRYGLMGSEVGSYERGVVNLNFGRATIRLPEYFSEVVDYDTISVQLTPHSLASEGLAVVQINEDTIEIGELRAGTGSYEVSYLVHGLVRGRQNQPKTLTDEELRGYVPAPETDPDLIGGESRKIGAEILETGLDAE